MFRKWCPQPLTSGSICFAAGIFLTFSSTCKAQAETNYLDLSPEQLLRAQVVSVSKTSETVAKAPAAVYVITQEDIARSGMTSIPELLRMAPGVNVARSDSNTWAVSIRGFNTTSANKLLVMIDGRPVYNPLFAGTFWEAQDMPLEDIDRIEIVRGPGGTLWGANAVNGVINIITKNTKHTQGNLVSAGGGNYENAFATVRRGGAMKGNGDAFYRVYAKYNNRDKFHSLGANQADDAWQNYRAGFRMDWGDRNSTDHTVLHGNVYREDSDAKANTYSLTAPFSTPVGETIKSSGANILQAWRHNYANGAALKLQYYFDYTERQQMLLQDKRLMFDIDSQYNLKQMGRHAITVGANYRVTSDNIGGAPQLVTFDPQRSTDILFSTFAQDKITLQPERWFLTLGSKFESSHYTGLEIQPNVRLEWLPDSRQTVWAAVSRAIRTPSRQERDLNISNIIVAPGVLLPGFPTEFILTANKDFSSEELIAYELGYRKQVTENFSIDTTAFVNDYKNLASAIVQNPVFVPAGADPDHWEFPIVAVNQMSGEVYGAEIAASWKVRSDWKLAAGYSYLDMYLHAPIALGNNQEGAEGRSPQHQANLRSYWNINDQWTLDTMAYYVSRLFKDGVPSYVRIDMNLGWSINKDLHFNLIGQNLFDNAHREFGTTTDANSTQVPRSVFGKLTWQF